MGKFTHRALWAGAAAGLAATLIVRSARRKCEFSGKNVVITGGSRGLGLVLAREFLARGARVAILARDASELARAAENLGYRGGEVLTLVCDITRQEQVDSAMANVRRELGPIDVLVNNAGVIAVGPMDAMTVEDYRESLAVHFWGPLFTTLAVLPEMRERREGRIVNISSIGGKISVPRLLPYSVGKFALTGFSEGLRAELLQDNVFVTSVYPGLMRTGSPRNAQFKSQNRAEYTWFSISDALPGFAINAERAARQIVNACQRGAATLIVSLPAKVAITLHCLFPGISATALGAVQLLLPELGGIGKQRAAGWQSHSSVSPSWITTLNQRAAQQNNEVA